MLFNIFSCFWRKISYKTTIINTCKRLDRIIRDVIVLYHFAYYILLYIFSNGQHVFWLYSSLKMKSYFYNHYLDGIRIVDLLFVSICKSSTDGGVPFFSYGMTVFRYCGPQTSKKNTVHVRVVESCYCLCKLIYLIAFTEMYFLTCLSVPEVPKVCLIPVCRMLDRPSILKRWKTLKHEILNTRHPSFQISCEISWIQTEL